MFCVYVFLALWLISYLDGALYVARPFTLRNYLPYNELILDKQGDTLRFSHNCDLHHNCHTFKNPFSLFFLFFCVVTSLSSQWSYRKPAYDWLTGGFLFWSATVVLDTHLCERKKKHRAFEMHSTFQQRLSKMEFNHGKVAELVSLCLCVCVL